MSRRLLQIVNGLVGLATVGLGAVQLTFGVDHPLYATAAMPRLPILDSNLRFFGGLGLGLGLTLLWLLPSIERRTALFRAVWACAFLGGLGRLLSWRALGAPAGPVVGFTLLEVLAAPALVVWQSRLAAVAAAMRSEESVG